MGSRAHIPRNQACIKGLSTPSCGGMLQLVAEQPAYVALFELHKEPGRNWAEVAVAAGVNPRSIEGWVKGRVPSPPLIPMLRIASELGIDPPDLFDAVLSGVVSAKASRVDALEERVRRLEILAELEAGLTRGGGPPSDQAPEAGSERA